MTRVEGTYASFRRWPTPAGAMKLPQVLLASVAG